MWFAGDREGDMSIWARTPITPEDLERMEVYASPAWFCDKDGNAVERTQFEYVRDHLGYRLEAKELNIDGEICAKGDINLQISLVNYGFAPVFNLKSEFVILDSNGNAITSCLAGDPRDWYNTDELKTHKISANITLPEEAGEYKLAFRLYNSAGDCAYLANDIEHLDGYNILTSFEI